MANRCGSAASSVVRPFPVLSTLCFLCCLLVALGSNAPAFAQMETATLAGTISGRRSTREEN